MTRPKDATLSAPDLDEVRRAVRLLEAFALDRALLTGIPDEERKALLIAAGRVSRPENHQQRRMLKAFRRARKEQAEVADRAARAATEIRAARQTAVYVPPARRLQGTAEGPAAPRELKQPRVCYVCKAEYRTLHFFYDAMCPPCAELNYEKRFQTAPLDGRVALVTGARVKIGFQASLKLLRAGAHVIATTRFPHDAARRYAREEDFGAWRHRLEVHGLDLRHAPSVELFARYLLETRDRLDILLNNAAQTVRRPPGFYAPLLPGETEPLEALPSEMRELLRFHEDCKARLAGHRAPSLPETAGESAAGALVSWSGGRAGVGIEASAALSQLPYTQEDLEDAREVFPHGHTDADLQQVDLRARNTWRLALAEVDTAEMLEVHLINAVAPFILCARLKPLMLRHRTGEQHVVNVSAMEGVFSRGTKTDKHPHTNMAKAALNMMTLTSARDYIQDGIHMNAVDTGWVTDEDPAAHASRKRDELGFEPPLDIVDGAARICDPFFSGLLTGEHVWGKFLKDYKPSSW
jgi:NAD(P)-dependent dehydrogenase (short-subunit alcohol dehydrogenase family)